MHSHFLSCLHLDMSEIKCFNCSQSLPSIVSCNNNILFLIPSSLAHHFPFYNVVEKVLVPKKMPKPSMLPAPNHFQSAPSFIGTYQHLFICHLLCPTDFQRPPPRPHFKCFQQLSTCFSQRPCLCCIQCY